MFAVNKYVDTHPVRQGLDDRLEAAPDSSDNIDAVDIFEQVQNATMDVREFPYVDEEQLRQIIREEIRPLRDDVNALVNLHRNPEEVFQLSALYALKKVMVRNNVDLDDYMSYDLLRNATVFSLYDELVKVLNFKYGARNAAHVGRSISTDVYGEWSARDLKKFLRECGVGFDKVTEPKADGEGETKIDYLRLDDATKLKTILNEKVI